MENTVQERRFSVRWYIHASHPKGGIFRGRTFFVSTSGAIFFAPVRYRIGDTLDMDIFVQPTRSVRCKAKVVADGSPYQVEFEKFQGEDQKIWNDTLLELHRTNVNKRR
jgi:hypothetical protein